MPPVEMAVTHVSPIGFWLTVSSVQHESMVHNRRYCMDPCRKRACVINDPGSWIFLLWTHRNKISIIPDNVILHIIIGSVFPGPNFRQVWLSCSGSFGGTLSSSQKQPRNSLATWIMSVSWGFWLRSQVLCQI